MGQGRGVAAERRLKLEVGQVVDRYTVDALIGAGGTAMVYRVRHVNLGTWHALKVLTLTSEAIRDRMYREGRVQASLRHLNIVTVTDVLDLDGAPGLLMEYIAGPSLERALGQYRLTMRDAETLFQGIVSGVRQAHLFGLVHRDLKPANVLLSRTMDGFVPKVTDFGLAKLLENDPGVAHTRSGIAMGTPSYMAPEQIRDARSVDQRADVWSLGCILYELVTRTRAFPGDEALPIYNAVTGGEYVPPREVIEDLPDRLDQAIRGCLTVDRTARVPDCDTLLEVLAGRQSWHVHGDAPRPSTGPSLPPSLPSDVPEMQVAARSVDGSTPIVPPPRSVPAPSASSSGGASGGLGVASAVSTTPAQARSESETVVTRGKASLPVDGTLDASDSLVDPEGDGSRWVGLALFGVGAVGLAVVVVVAVVALVGSYLWKQVEEPSLGDAVAVAPATDGEQEPVAAPDPVAVPRPDAPAPQPAPQVQPAAAPKAAPAAAPAIVQPAPRPVAAPVAPQVVQVKLLSAPPTASLLVDGQPSGRTPGKLELTVGRHAVQVQSGETIADFVVDVQAGRENKWCWSFPTSSRHEGACP